jgi:ferric-dicitrate binding protein FerR (iron transport regulator)
MALGCVHMRSLMVTALAGRASEAERLALESHLADCAACRDEHDALAGVRRLRHWEPAPLSDGARERVRRAALAALDQPARPERSRRPLLVAGLTSLAAAAALLIVILRPPPSRIVDGDVAIVGVAGKKIPPRAELHAAGAGHVILDGPKVALAAGTDLGWDLASRTVALAHGTLDVDVDPHRHQRFRVKTPRFFVEVLGTRFTVTGEGVRTERGKVRVSQLDGTPIRIVAAGEAWSLPTPPVPSAPPPPPAPIRVAAPQAPIAVDVGPGSAPAAAGEAGRRRLAEARQALSSGDGEAARALLQPLLRKHGLVAVEARTLVAESYLVQRRYDEAIDNYRAILALAPRAPQAESALYAVAQLQLESGQREAAARTLTRYLARYPHGRFAHEARERLELIAHPS